MKICKITTAKLKCTREHILGHDWVTKITWDLARERGEFRVCKVQNIPHANFFTFILLISNHAVFLVQFGINLHLWVVQRAEIALTETAHAISAFWITHSCKLIPNWTRNRVITYTTRQTGLSIPGIGLYCNQIVPWSNNIFRNSKKETLRSQNYNWADAKKAYLLTKTILVHLL